MTEYVTFAVHEPKCPACNNPHLSARRPFPGESDAKVRCDYCGATSPSELWFDYTVDNDGIEDMPER
ncbi:MAG: hypothetical protein JWR51_1030 [Devosia sp.]|uniref:hypothetical protein n=1 Tax=Devosia sp. TaxID=1871048 RepID=UPI002601DC15|nr:hypothetical protein [Devosia sp.]MDB5527927.1 hypothetical protein [Devosia sp.]